MVNKIKVFTLIIIVSLTAWQCGGSGDSPVSGKAAADSFTVSGQMTGWENDSLVIQELYNNSMQKIQTIILDENGRFEFSDTARNPRFLFMLTSDNQYISLLLLNGQKLKISANKENFNDSYKISGSKESKLVWELNSEMRKASLELDSLSKIYYERQGSEAGPQLDSWLQSKYEELKTNQKIYITEFIDRHYESPASLLALSHQLGNQPILSSQLDFSYFSKVDAALSKKYPESSLVATLHNFVEGVQAEKKMAANSGQSTALGSIAPEIELADPDGKAISLSSFRGKYVLLDFWAAWCGPCRRENPNLVKAYANYKSKGFEIFQVSLDRTREEWVRAIEADKLNWTHVSDLKYWSSIAAKKYGVQSIPASFLLDLEGKIIARNLRGPALEEKLKELMK